MSKAPRSNRIEIPILLADSVKSKRAMMFLGAGASKEATNGSGKSPPDANQLRDALANRFFGKPISNRDLMAVAEMAIESSGGMPLVFEEVRRAYDGFRPSKAHLLLPTFNWRMIATTNYDLLVETAYALCTDAKQTLVRFVKDDEPVEERMQSVSNPLSYLKIHGCLEHLYDTEIPLVLSREQYSKYSNNRKQLYNRLEQSARESTVIFVGYRLDDAHVRDLIYK